jgi:hypothetical protein
VRAAPRRRTSQALTFRRKFLLCSIGFRLGRWLVGESERRPIFDIVYQCVSVCHSRPRQTVQYPKVTMHLDVRQHATTLFCSPRASWRGAEDPSQQAILRASPPLRGSRTGRVAAGHGRRPRWTWGGSLEIVIRVCLVHSAAPDPSSGGPADPRWTWGSSFTFRCRAPPLDNPRPALHLP